MNEKKAGKILFGIILFISIYTLFLCSEAPLWVRNQYTIWFFEKPKFNSDIYMSLAASYIISCIFYMIVSYLPERKKRKDIEPYVNSSLKDIELYIKSMFDKLAKSADIENFDINKLTKLDIDAMCRSSQPKRKDHHQFYLNNIIEVNNAQSIANKYYGVIKRVDSLLVYMFFLDSEIIKILNEIKQAKFRITIELMQDIEVYSGNNDLEPWSNEFYEFYEIYKKLIAINKS